HERAMEEYIELIDRQSRLFRQGYGRAARGLDTTVYRMKAKREEAINTLPGHQATHWQLDSLMPHAGAHFLDIPELDDDHVALGRMIAELELLGENNAAV